MNKILEYITNSEEVEPETLRQQFPDLSSLDVQKILALSTLKTSRIGYEDMDVFENLCLVLNDIAPNPKTMQGVAPRHIAWFFKILSKLFKTLPEFSDEVVVYIKEMHRDKGVIFYPEEFTQIENKDLETIKELAENGPFPLHDDELDQIQAIRYLKIQEHIKEKTRQLKELSKQI